MKKATLHQGNKNYKFIIFLICTSFILFSCKKKYVEFNSEEIKEKRNNCWKQSIDLIGAREYWQIYNQANDSINCWIDNKLSSYLLYKIYPYQIDSLLCFNKNKDKLITSISYRLSTDTNHDGIVYFYGINIKGNWYFFEGPSIHLPREFYQEDIHTPLSFEKMKQIATNNIYRGYLKKDKNGNWEINESFFSDLTSVAWCSDCKTQDEWNAAYLRWVQYNWQQRDTTEY